MASPPTTSSIEPWPTSAWPLLERHGVVIYREADISDADLVAFSRMLGEVVIAPLGNHAVYPEISAVTR